VNPPTLYWSAELAGELQRGDPVTRVFLFALAMLGMGVVASSPPFAVLVLIHRYTNRPAWFWAWLVGLVVYIAAATAVISTVVIDSGLVEWVAS
jgi:amino acid transporter